ncbi:MAG: TonB-dependent receptor [Blastocatellia bacterium]|nr:TonB-dependent receptor [Blastocatellia bacterium]
MGSLLFGCLGVALLAAGATEAWGQSYQGALRGSMRDSSGNVLSGTTLTITNEETNVVRTTITNEAGEYFFDRVDPGKYRIAATLSGFKKTERMGVLIETQQQMALDLVMEVGSVVETVVITGDVPLMETTSASTGTVLSKQILDDLPNSGRNPFAISAITPTVIPVGNPTFNRQQDQTGSSAISLGGGPVRGNNYIIDGVPITDLRNRAVVIPSLEAVQEVKVQVNTYDAEAGRTGGGFFNTLARSGSNDLHGSAFGFLRPSSLQANNFFNNRRGIAKPDAPYKLYGGAFGGAVRIPWLYDGKDKTFFWTSFEGYRMDTFLSETFTVPTERERVGDFSQTPNLVVRDPLTGQPFAGNIVPGNRFDPVGAKLVTFFPKANGAGFLNNYSATSTLSDRADQQTVKLDHSLTEAWKMSGFYAHYGSREPEADYYGNIANPNGYLLFRNVHALAFNNIISLDPTTVLSLRYGYNTFGDNTTTISAGFDPAQLGFPNSFLKDVNFKKFPRVFVVGNAYGASNAAFGSAAPSDQVYYSHNLLGSVSKLIGKHSLKIGADYRRMATDFTEYGQASGTFYFNSNETGNAIANMLLGRLDYTRTNTAQIATPIAAYLDYGAVYAQDDYRVNTKLTINAGLRYEVETGLRERESRLTVGFDRAAASPLKVPGLDLKGGLLYAGVNGAPEAQTATFHKFAPRVGFAYRWNEKTTIRGGYGIFWAPPIFAFSITGLGALGYSSITTVSPGAPISNPFPNGLNQPIGSSLGLLTNVGDAIHFVDQDRKAAYVQQYSLDVQRELPFGVTATVSYIGSRGSKLQIGGINDSTFNINQLTADKLSDPNLLTSVANPFFGIIKTGFLSGATVQKRQLLRPFPQFGDIFVHGASAGRSMYHSFTVKGQKRLTSGLSFLTSYTFSQMKDNIIGQGNFYAGTSGFAPNIYDLSREYGLASIDLTHRVLISGSYELPFGKGKPFLNTGGIVGAVTGGWQVNFIGTMQSGYPLSITQANNNTNAFSSGQRPNLVAGASIASDDPMRRALSALASDGGYFNAAAFSTAPAGTFGTLGRTVDLRSPGQRNWDIGITKDTAILEKLRAQLRLEAINAFNTPVFRAPNTTFGSSSFGKITAQANFARVVQLSVRLMW